MAGAAASAKARHILRKGKSMTGRKRKRKFKPIRLKYGKEQTIVVFLAAQNSYFVQRVLHMARIAIKSAERILMEELFRLTREKAGP
ncbi:hypothetical protein ACLBWS_12565 [Brucellaceae bacterium D45D]